jgi:hypothetical protein
MIGSLLELAQRVASQVVDDDAIESARNGMCDDLGFSGAEVPTENFRSRHLVVDDQAPFGPSSIINPEIAPILV